MSDCCYMSVTCRRQDAGRFKDLGFKIYGNSHDDAIVGMQDHEANYAHYGSMPDDIPYYGKAGAGHEYGPEVFACDGKEIHWVPIMEMGPAVCVRRDGTLEQSQLEEIKLYYACLERAEKILEQHKQPTENAS